MQDRLRSLDAFRGLVIFAMIFVNFLHGIDGIPFFLQHAPAKMDAITLADTVFPGFLFIVGVAIPLALWRRLSQSEELWGIIAHVFARSAVLIFLGVIMVNKGQYSAVATGMSMESWYLLAYLATLTFLFTSANAANPRYFWLYLVLKAISATALFYLILKFSGENKEGATVWFQHSWWGILGIIGWVYFAACSLYFFVNGRQKTIILAIPFMIAFYVAGRFGYLTFLGSLNHLFNVGNVFGSHLAITTCGMAVGNLFCTKDSVYSQVKKFKWMFTFSVVLIVAGFLLRPIHGFSKIYGTESWALVTSGISCLLFSLFYYYIDIRKIRLCCWFLAPIGKNALLAYLLPAIVQYSATLLYRLTEIKVWVFLWPFYKTGGFLAIINAFVVTLAMGGIVWFLTSKRLIVKI